MKRRLRKKTLFIIPLVLLAGVAVVFFLTRGSNTPGDSTAVSSAGKNPTINYGPPTEDEKQQAEDHKDELVRQQEEQNNPPPSGNKKQVTVTITSNPEPSGPEVVITGFIQGIVEDGGTCTAKLTKGNEQKTATSKGFADVSTTNCPPMSVQLDPGNWQLVLSYSSAAAAGTATKALTVK